MLNTKIRFTFLSAVFGLATATSFALFSEVQMQKAKIEIQSQLSEVISSNVQSAVNNLDVKPKDVLESQQKGFEEIKILLSEKIDQNERRIEELEKIVNQTK